MPTSLSPTSREVLLSDNDLIVSKTCTKGRITYANRRFMTIAGYSEQELLGAPHNIIRHPDMPKGVYRFMWQTLKEGQEFFGFVKNLCADGSFYWVFANVTPDMDDSDVIRGFYSVRRKPPETAIRAVEPLYQQMRSIEASDSGSAAIDQSVSFLKQWLKEQGLEYNTAMVRLYKNYPLAG